MFYICIVLITKTKNMKKLTLVELNDKIKLENDIFNKMSKAEKRVAIAKDCLARIELEQVIPKMNKFCRFESKFDKSGISIKNALEQTNEVVCSACAKGSLFMSYIGRVNNFTFNEVANGNDNDDNEHTKLLEIFTIRQLALIEYAFEGNQYINYDLNDNPLIFNSFDIDEFRYKNFNSNIETDKDTQLMIAICNNIIRNNGTFNLKK